MAYCDGFPPDGSALMSLRSPLPLRASSGFSPDSLLAAHRDGGRNHVLRELYVETREIVNHYMWN